MKLNVLRLVTCVTASAVLASASGSAVGATLSTGYILGGASQLLSANGGSGDTLFVDTAATGGPNDPSYPPFPAAASVLLPGAGLWNVGDTVSITGVAFAIRGNTAPGNITFDIRQGAGGSGPTGAGGLASLGTASASYADTTTMVHYVNFDSPVTFVADANSTTIGINMVNDGGVLGLKSWDNDGGMDRLQQYNYVNGNAIGGMDHLNFSVAGTVIPIPEPASLLLACCGFVGIVAAKRRR